MKKGDIVEGGEKSKTDCNITETSSANKDVIAPWKLTQRFKMFRFLATKQVKLSQKIGIFCQDSNQLKRMSIDFELKVSLWQYSENFSKFT